VAAGKTTIVNPGMAARGLGALVDVVLEEEPHVTLIEA